MNEKLYIVGAGSVGGHIASNPLLYSLETVEIYFLDDNPLKVGSLFVQCPVLDRVDYLLKATEPTSVVIGIAFPKIKEVILTKLKQNAFLKFPTLVAKNAWVSNSVEIGKGCIIYPGCSINYGSTLKDFVVMNMNCALGHHSKLGNFSSLAPGVNLGGHTVVGDGVDIGIGSATIQGVHIGDGSVVGGQAMVTQSFPANSKIVGIPAKSVFKEKLL